MFVFKIRVTRGRTRRELVRDLFVNTRPADFRSWVRAIVKVAAGEPDRFERLPG